MPSHARYAGYLTSPASRRWRWGCLGISYSRHLAFGTSREHGQDSDDSFRTQARHLARTRVQNVQTGGGCVQRHGNGAGLPIACAAKRAEGATAEFLERAESIMRRRGWEFQGEFERAFCEMGQSGRIECGGWFAKFLSTAAVKTHEMIPRGALCFCPSASGVLFCFCPRALHTMSCDAQCYRLPGFRFCRAPGCRICGCQS